MTFQLIIGDQVITSLDTDCNYRQYIVALQTLTNIIELKRQEYQNEIDRQHRLLIEEIGNSNNEQYQLDWSSTEHTQAIPSNNVMTEFRC